MDDSFDELKLTGNLPTPAGVGMTILRITQRDDYAADEISRAVLSDPALTGRILKVANSAATAGLKPVRTVNDAVVRLGARTVGNIALGFTLISAYREGTCRAFDYRRYWSLSLARAVAAQALADAVKVPPAEAYICGLLAGIGRLALACVHPESYAHVLRRCRPGGDHAQLVVLEQQTFGIDHRELARSLFADWQLPAAFGNAIASGDEPAGDAAAESLRVLLGAASAIAEMCLAPDGAHALRWKDVAARRDGLGISEDALSAATGRIVAEWQEWGRALDIDTSAPPPIERIRADVAHFGEENDPLVVLAVEGDAAELDSLCQHLEGGGFRVLRATNGDEALKLALDTSPHLLVTASSLPGMSGVELTRMLRRAGSGKEMFILLAVDRNQEDEAAAAFDAGIDDYVVKPYDARVLMSRIGAGERTVRLQEKILRDKRHMEHGFAELGVMRRRLQVLSVTDPLTDLVNRGKAMELLDGHWSEGRPLSVIALDIDELKRVNDEAGHAAGDKVLQEAARLFRASVRKGDVVCRLGGEEFLVICPGADLEAAGHIAERLRSELRTHRMETGAATRSVTCSLGVAQRAADMPHPEHLLNAAAEALLAAKQQGRDRVKVWSPESGVRR